VITSNQADYGRSRRFDRRAALLRKLGFTYTVADGLSVGLFVRRVRFLSNPQAIPAAVLHYADNRAWIDVLRLHLRRGVKGGAL